VNIGVSKIVSISVIIVLVAGGLFFVKSVLKTDTPASVEGELTKKESLTKNQAMNQKIKDSMHISSRAFEHNSSIPSKYTCDGENINPPFSVSDVPEGTVSLVFIMDDPDVPTYIRKDGMWDHWVKFNIPPILTVIEEGKEPPGTSGAGTSGNIKYHGPCPPDREHRYFFKIYALNAELDLEEGASKKDVETAMAEHILDSAELIGLYSRK